MEKLQDSLVQGLGINVLRRVRLVLGYSFDKDKHINKNKSKFKD